MLVSCLQVISKSKELEFLNINLLIFNINLNFACNLNMDVIYIQSNQGRPVIRILEGRGGGHKFSEVQLQLFM